MKSAADLLSPTCRVALAAMLHDIGKFAERAQVFDERPSIDVKLQAYSPFHPDGGRFSHRHAANTEFAFDAIERLLPDCFFGDCSPFATTIHSADGSGQQPTDSLVNAAAAHHKPESFLQWVIATADRIASGFEREAFDQYNASQDERYGLNHRTLRQQTLFERLQLEGPTEKAENALEWRYPLAPLSPAGVFPEPAATCETRDETKARAEYEQLWNGFLKGLAQIPATHRADAALWLDHFDSLWLTYTQAIPATTVTSVTPDISLYDHSHTTAALAAALWRWHEAMGDTGHEAATRLRERADFDEQKFLLIQGDFFGIQEFIFAQGGETRRQAAKLLRGRSFQVSLFTELAALRILEALGLPSTSQLINAAGKFLIVAPKTAQTIQALDAVKLEFDQWFLKNAFGLAGIGLAHEPAACADFIGQRYGALSERLHLSLERAKYQRFSLCKTGASIFTDADFPYGPCAWNGRLPADKEKRDGEAASCAISRDQVLIGKSITDHDRILVVPAGSAHRLATGARLKRLELPVFGYALAFTDSGEATGAFGALAAEGALRRCWDYSLPDAPLASTPPWHGYARRSISGYVPRMRPDDLTARDRYQGAEADGLPDIGELKTLDMLACEDRMLDESGKWQGIAALGILKGDIDNLGELFRIGLPSPSFAKYAALSRQVNAFFTLWLPYVLAAKHKNVYTVFAGGDDFFLIGPWRSIQRLASEMREAFARYVAGNAEIHFSAGIATQKAGAPITALAELAEEALTAAKGHEGKDALTCFGETIPWSKWPAIQSALHDLDALRNELGGRLSTGYVYGLLQFVDARAREQQGDATAAMWRSRFAYRTRRFVVDRLKERDEHHRRERYVRIAEQIASRGIDALGSAYRIALFSYLYRSRSH